MLNVSDSLYFFCLFLSSFSWTWATLIPTPLSILAGLTARIQIQLNSLDISSCRLFSSSTNDATKINLNPDSILRLMCNQRINFYFFTLFFSLFIYFIFPGMLWLKYLAFKMFSSFTKRTLNILHSSRNDLASQEPLLHNCT